MVDTSAKRVEIVMRYSTVVTVYALLSATPAFAAGGGAIAWDRETGKYGASWNQPTPKQLRKLQSVNVEPAVARSS